MKSRWFSLVFTLFASIGILFSFFSLLANFFKHKGFLHDGCGVALRKSAEVSGALHQNAR